MQSVGLKEEVEKERSKRKEPYLLGGRGSKKMVA